MASDRLSTLSTNTWKGADQPFSGAYYFADAFPRRFESILVVALANSLDLVTTSMPRVSRNVAADRFRAECDIWNDETNIQSGFRWAEFVLRIRKARS